MDKSSSNTELALTIFLSAEPITAPTPAPTTISSRNKIPRAIKKPIIVESIFRKKSIKVVVFIVKSFCICVAQIQNN